MYRRLWCSVRGVKWPEAVVWLVSTEGRQGRANTYIAKVVLGHQKMRRAMDLKAQKKGYHIPHCSPPTMQASL